MAGSALGFLLAFWSSAAEERSACRGGWIATTGCHRLQFGHQGIMVERPEGASVGQVVNLPSEDTAASAARAQRSELRAAELRDRSSELRSQELRDGTQG